MIEYLKLLNESHVQALFCNNKWFTSSSADSSIGYLSSVESNVHICSTFVQFLNLELFYGLFYYISVVEVIGEHRILYHFAALKLVSKLLQTLNKLCFS